MSYDTAFFDAIRDGCRQSAEVIAPLVLKHYPAQTVVDVGCGEGWFGKAFAERGCEVVGFEAYADPVIPNRRYDLTEPIPTDEEFDLAVCLEVAEHLPPERADSFIRELCNLAPVVLFSAAVPGQGGEGHLNEQWPAYWVERFVRHGYGVSDALRWRIWNDDRVDSWYRQNLLIAYKVPVAASAIAPLDQWHEIQPVIHPAFFADLMDFIHNMAAQGRIEWS